MVNSQNLDPDGAAFHELSRPEAKGRIAFLSG
jgi:hypothetical protein